MDTLAATAHKKKSAKGSATRVIDKLENIFNAAKLLAGRDVERVVVVTSDYHLPRALALAEDAGFEASGIGAPTKLGVRYWVKNHGREALAWIKYWGQKYLRLPLE